MLIHDKHEGWLTACDDCENGQVRNHGASYLSDTGDCPTCDGAGHWQADLDDFDGLTVKLNTGETVDVEAGMFWLDGDELREADVDDIADVLDLAL
jgi:hypothetical protein